MIYLNITAPTLIARHYGEAMVRRGKGGILLISSLLGLSATPYFAVYGATKAYIIAFGESLSSEMAPLGVDVSVLAPGLTDTAMAGVVMVNNPGFPVDTPGARASEAWLCPLQAVRPPRPLRPM
jgi:short-subunit dehydrogenase